MVHGVENVPSCAQTLQKRSTVHVRGVGGTSKNGTCTLQKGEGYFNLAKVISVISASLPH